MEKETAMKWLIEELTVYLDYSPARYWREISDIMENALYKQDEERKNTIIKTILHMRNSDSNKTIEDLYEEISPFV